MKLTGSKFNRDIYKNLIVDNLPTDLNDRIYIEPFGGSMGLCKIIIENYKPRLIIYNDLYEYGSEKIFVDPDLKYHLDYREIFDKYDRDNTFFYIDPPYIGKEHYYKKTFENGLADHYDLYKSIIKLKGKWLLSYYENPILREWYGDYKFDEYKGHSMHHKSEIVIRNY